ncbi:MAG: hypothetical protein HOM71_07800 [Deltaproteobacteria bacterium]|jgi:hypothetical protein|nr:hypothetical protein [Deltaproteobacteria bacterium]MBT5087371.1 hypothetical protein [Deltaproteobacteria bacterium]
MNSITFLVKTLLIFFTSLFFTTPGWGQSNNSSGNIFGIQQTQLSGFSDDERVKVLLLNLLPSGITETAAVEIAKALQLNVYNTNHFSVVGPSEWNAQIKDRNPTLADCHDIACGVMIGKMFHADKVLVGTIHSEIMLNDNGKEERSIILSIRLVDTRTNITDFTDEVQFNDLKMHDELFRMAERISDNSLLLGNVLAVKHSGIIINLGRAQGIKIGHRLVISRRKSFKSDSAENTVGKTFQKIALAEIVQVSDLSSEAVIVQKILSVAKGDQIQTYVNNEKLIYLITQTRKELDIQKKLKPKNRVIRLGPTVTKVSTDFSNWSKRFNLTKSEHDRWLYTTVGAGAATILFLSGTFNISGFLSILPWVAGAGSVYSGIKYFHYREMINELSTEGRSRGFLNSSLANELPGWHWTPVKKGFNIAWVKHF